MHQTRDLSIHTDTEAVSTLELVYQDHTPKSCQQRLMQRRHLKKSHTVAHTWYLIDIVNLARPDLTDRHRDRF